MCPCVRPSRFVCPPGNKQIVCPPGGKHFLHTGGGGDKHFSHTWAGQTFFVGGGGGYDDVNEEIDVSEASMLSAGARIFKGL